MHRIRSEPISALILSSTAVILNEVSPKRIAFSKITLLYRQRSTVFWKLTHASHQIGTNICTHFKLNRGDIERGFAEADRIFEDNFTLPATQHSFLETHACIASDRNQYLHSF